MAAMRHGIAGIPGTWHVESVTYESKGAVRVRIPPSPPNTPLGVTAALATCMKRIPRAEPSGEMPRPATGSGPTQRPARSASVEPECHERLRPSGTPGGRPTRRSRQANDGSRQQASSSRSSSKSGVSRQLSRRGRRSSNSGRLFFAAFADAPARLTPREAVGDRPWLDVYRRFNDRLKQGQVLMKSDAATLKRV